MKNEADLSRLARQWGASAGPFGLVNAQDWLETPVAHPPPAAPLRLCRLTATKTPLRRRRRAQRVNKSE